MSEQIEDGGIRRVKSILISIGILALIVTGGFLLYQVAYSQGETSGYSDGYSQGYVVGQEEGYNSGQADGYQQGETAGYQLGRQDGYEEGYRFGEADGYEAGAEVGYEEGIEDGLGHGYTIQDPTYKQVIAFLKEDNIDNKNYVKGSYICSHFARDVCNNAEDEGLRCAYVGLVYPEGGHAIIAFNTIDEGLVYFEPQSDDIVTPVIGRRYYKCIEPSKGYYYEKPAYDDTIQDILVIW